MTSEIDNYFLQKEEPQRSCLLSLRSRILLLNAEVTEAWRYGMPFYRWKGRRFCYLWVHRKKNLPYIGIVDGGGVEDSRLIRENRSRMKIMLVNPRKDLPVRAIDRILKKAIKLMDEK